MKKSCRYIAVICFALLLCSCVEQTDYIPSVNIPYDFDEVIEIKRWLAIGPFEFDTDTIEPKKLFLHEDLKPYGIREGHTDNLELKELHDHGVNMFIIDGISPHVQLINYVRDEIESKSNCYLVSSIYSEKQLEATLLLDGSHSYAIWFNGEELTKVTGKFNTSKVGDRFINISLKEGENQLFAKVNRNTNLSSWDFICAIAPPDEAKRIFRVNYANDFVVNPLVDDSIIEIYTGPYSSCEIEVSDEQGQIVISASSIDFDTNEKPFSISGFDELSEGFYKTVLTVGEEKLEEMIYNGNCQELVNCLNKEIRKNKNKGLYTSDLTAALERVNHLNESEMSPNSSSDIRFVNRNRVFWGYSLYCMSRGNARTQLITYEDRDGDHGVFIFHKKDIQKECVPLVIVVPYTRSNSPLVRSWYCGNLDQIETDNAIADEYGFAMAWIFAGGGKYSANGAEKEIDAVIDHLCVEKGVDRRKIFLLGNCTGGQRALVQLALTPDRYAACAVFAPVTLSGEVDNTPIHMIPQMGKVPVMILHGVNDETISVENSRLFVAEAQKKGLSIKYIETTGSHVDISKDCRKPAFEFFNSTMTDLCDKL